MVDTDILELAILNYEVVNAETNEVRAKDQQLVAAGQSVDIYDDVGAIVGCSQSLGTFADRASSKIEMFLLTANTQNSCNPAFSIDEPMPIMPEKAGRLSAIG